MYYIENLETQKLELYFDKTDYKSLSDDKKTFIKKHFLFSRNKQSWISKALNTNTYAFNRLKNFADEIGLKNNGLEGKKINFAEKMDIKQKKAISRLEKYRYISKKLNNESNNIYNEAKKMSSVIVFGQPILIGHHSEKKDRNFRGKIHNKFKKAFLLSDKAAKINNKDVIDHESNYTNQVFLMNRINECEAIIRKSQKYNTTKSNYYIEIKEKLEFYQKKLKELGGLKFSSENLKVGMYILDNHNRIRQIKKINKKTITVNMNCSFFDEPCQDIKLCSCVSNLEYERVKKIINVEIKTNDFYDFILSQFKSYKINFKDGLFSLFFALYPEYKETFFNNYVKIYNLNWGGYLFKKEKTEIENIIKIFENIDIIKYRNILNKEYSTKKERLEFLKNLYLRNNEPIYYLLEIILNENILISSIKIDVPEKEENLPKIKNIIDADIVQLSLTPAFKYNQVIKKADKEVIQLSLF